MRRLELFGAPRRTIHASGQLPRSRTHNPRRPPRSRRAAAPWQARSRGGLPTEAGHPSSRACGLAVPMVLLAIGADLRERARTHADHRRAVAAARTRAPVPMVTVSPHRSSTFPFYGIPLVRAVGVLSLYYFFGRKYGDAAPQWWAEVCTGRRALRPVLWIERQFHLCRYGIPVLFPGNARRAAGRRGPDAVLALIIVGDIVDRRPVSCSSARWRTCSRARCWTSWTGSARTSSVDYRLVPDRVRLGGGNQRGGIEPVASVEELAGDGRSRSRGGLTATSCSPI